MVANKVFAISTIVLLACHSSSANELVRDPFATLSNAPAVPKSLPLLDNSADSRPLGLELRAILWGQEALANISGMIVAKGDRIHNYTVIELSQNNVVLRQGDKTLLLVLDEDS